MGLLKARVAGQWVDILGSNNGHMHGYTYLNGITPPSAEGTWAGTPITLPVPVGTVNVPVSASITAYAINFTSATTAPLSVWLDLSSDGGSTWQRTGGVETVPFGQTGSPVINRTTIALSGSWTVPVVTQPLQIRVRIQEGASRSGTATGMACLQWWVGGGTLPGLAMPVSPSQPLGVIAVGGLAAVNAPHVTAAGSDSQLTAYCPAYFAIGRRYRISFSVRAMNAPAAQAIRLFLRDGPSTNMNVNDKWWWIPLGNYSGPHVEFLFDGDGTTKQVAVILANPGAVLNLYVDVVGQFYIEDVGPNQSPALPIPDTPPAWNILPFAAPQWSNYGSGGAPLSYRKIGDVVMVRGECNFATGVGNPMATLPTGFRPPYVQHFPVANRTASTTALTANINTDGTININGLPGVTVFGVNCIFSVTP